MRREKMMEIIPTEKRRKVSETLIDIIQNGQQSFRRIMFDTELIIRKSCGF